MTTLFVGEAITCIRSERRVFEGLNFRLEGGQALLLKGPNGSGKSSLLRMLAGLLRPAAGTLSWGGASVTDDPEAHRARLAYVGHADPVKATLTVAENLLFWAEMRGDPEESVSTALAAFNLSALAHQPGRFLSAGQRRRLNLARLKLRPSALWLLDEPTTGLDAASSAALMAAIRDHRAAGGTVVLSTHVPLDLDGPATLDLADFAPTSATAMADLLA